ncbi:MAG: FKBP-type peptidyl-prolyl cis-trans isomerase [bacterium]|nr:FKBP-type peptidyl-prolyl cis-trans isomerase [bacterium]
MGSERRRALVTLLTILTGVWSCAGDDNPAGAADVAVETNAIPTVAVIYADTSLAAADTIVTASGLRYIEIEAGTGRRPGRGSLVSVHYTGLLEDGTVFDSSYPRRAPFQFALGQGVVIPGWDEGIALMLEGARGRLIIPPDLGYGARGAGNVIPPNATILFDVWLANVD